jgi:hypothetical protein
MDTDSLFGGLLSHLDIGYPKKQTQGHRSQRKQAGFNAEAPPHLNMVSNPYAPESRRGSPQELHRSCSRFEAGRVMSCASDAVRERENV